MKFIICFDSFKESIPAARAVLAVKKGWQKLFPRAEYECLPLSDGGEGLIGALERVLGGRKKHVQVQDPLGREIQAQYLWIAASKTAVVESAEAVGLRLLSKRERNPMQTSSYGFGQLLKAAYEQGAEKIIIGLGGSTTVDGGTGMMQALGIVLKNSAGKPVGRGGKQLAVIKEIDRHKACNFEGCTLEIACDVTNPLLGQKGAALFFGAQKGAGPAMQKKLEQGMHNFAQTLRKSYALPSLKHFEKRGYGAAGGLATTLNLCFNAQIQSGIELVLSKINFAKKLQGASLVITGEGSVDSQSQYGKVIWGVLQECQKQQLPVCIITGTVGKGYSTLYKQGASAIFAIHKKLQDPDTNWNEIKKTSYTKLQETASDIAAMYSLGSRIR